MRVKILHPFSVDTASGRVRYQAGQIVADGQKNWIDKGLAVEDRPEPAKVSQAAPAKKSAD